MRTPHIFTQLRTHKAVSRQVLVGMSVCCKKIPYQLRFILQQLYKKYSNWQFSFQILKYQFRFIFATHLVKQFIIP